MRDVKRYYVYILRCFDGTFYVGVTNDVDRRFGERCEGVDPDCYTHDRRPLRLVHASEFESHAIRAAAIAKSSGAPSTPLRYARDDKPQT
jgi:predicted GIY-YIG superfamily endonuclease